LIDPALGSEAVALMMGDRMASHGNPVDTLGRIGQMWSGYLGRELSAHDVAQMMTLLKIARSRHAYDRDHYLDAIAYQLLAEDMARP